MAGFLINLVPVFTTVIAVALRRETATWTTWTGIGLCMVGLAVMGSAAGGFGRIGWSAGLVVAAALCFATYTLSTKPLFKRYSPLEVTVYTTVAGSVPFLVFAPGSVNAVLTAPPAAIITLLVLSVFHGCIASIFWVRAVSGMTAGVASRFLYLIPVLGVGVAWVWVAEAPVVATVIGGLLTVGGVALSTVRTAGMRREALTRSPAAPVVGTPLADAA
jgi:drug/metabolite transporter (DMT)-like permease